MGQGDFDFQRGLPYDFLGGVEHIQRSDTSFDFSIHDLSPESFGLYANYAFKGRRKGELVDVGHKMIRSFNERSDFTIGEQTVAQDFFWKDYSFSIGCVQECLTAFERGGKWETKNPAYLSLVLVGRAEESLQNAGFFSELLGSEQGEQVGFSECFADLVGYRLSAHLATEFPDNYYRLTDLITRRDRAADPEVEDYELAAKIRDEIYMFTRLRRSKCSLLWNDDDLS